MRTEELVELAKRRGRFNPEAVLGPVRDRDEFVSELAKELTWKVHVLTDLHGHAVARVTELQPQDSIDVLHDRMLAFGSAFPAAEGLPSGSIQVDSTHAELIGLQQENAKLKRCLDRYAPYRRFFKVAMAFDLFFAGAMLLQGVSGAPLISPLLGWTGIAVSTSALILSYLRSAEGDHPSQDGEKRD